MSSSRGLRSNATRFETYSLVRADSGTSRFAFFTRELRDDASATFFVSPRAERMPDWWAFSRTRYIDAVRPAKTAKAIRDDHTYFNHLGISWLMLYTTATSLADAETAALAERGYQDTTKMIMHVDRILPKIVVEELRENKQLSPVDVQDQTRVLVKNAWDREAPSNS